MLKTQELIDVSWTPLQIPLRSPRPFRKLHPAILMVQSTQYIARNDAPAVLNGPQIRRIFVQAEMGAGRVVIM